MLNIEQNFQKNGYCEGPIVLNEKEILNLRELLEKSFKSKGYPKAISLFDIDNKEVIKTICKIYNSHEIKNFILNLSRNFKEKVSLIPRFVIQRNYHVDRLESPGVGWHRDCGGELKYKYCVEKLSTGSYVFGKLGIYLQKNSLYGGSIDVIPNSHKYIKLKKFILRKITGINLFLVVKVQKYFPKIYKFLSENFFMNILRAKRLYPEVGSFVMFDSRIVHRGSPIDDSVRANVDFQPKEHFADVNKKYTKFSLYVDVGSRIALDSYLYDRNRRKGYFQGKNQTKIEIKELDTIKKELSLLENYLPTLAAEMKNIFADVIRKHS